jgi:hypothetical protein
LKSKQGLALSTRSLAPGRPTETKPAGPGTHALLCSSLHHLHVTHSTHLPSRRVLVLPASIPFLSLPLGQEKVTTVFTSTLVEYVQCCHFLGLRHLSPLMPRLHTASPPLTLPCIRGVLYLWQIWLPCVPHHGCRQIASPYHAPLILQLPMAIHRWSLLFSPRAKH